MSSAYRVNGETGTTVTFTNASTTYSVIGAEIYLSGAGPVPTTFDDYGMMGFFGI